MRPADDIELIEDPAELAAHFSDHRGIHLYALADLEEPFWTPSRWYRRGAAVVGVVSMPDGDGAAVYAVATISPEAALDLLVDLLPELPSGQLVTGPVGLAAAVGAERPMAWHGPHLRYRLTDPTQVPPRIDEVVDLGRGDLAELEALYATEPNAAFFRPHMLDDETFVAVRRLGRLVSAAGTHVVSEAQGVAAIGAVYTHPDHRGGGCLLYTSPSPRDRQKSRMPSSA